MVPARQSPLRLQTLDIYTQRNLPTSSAQPGATVPRSNSLQIPEGESHVQGPLLSRLYHHQKLIIVAFLSLSIPRKEDAAKLKSESEKGLAAGFLPGLCGSPHSSLQQRAKAGWRHAESGGKGKDILMGRSCPGYSWNLLLYT